MAARAMWYVDGVPVGVAAGGGGGGAPTGSAGGDLAGTYPNPTVGLLKVTAAQIAAANKDGLANIASLRTLGTGAQQASAGNDARIIGALQAANNLSGLDDASVARTNLGLGTAATQASGAFDAAGVAAAALTIANAYTDAKSWKTPCRAATTANITLSGAQTIDGVSAIAGDRVLVKDQTTGSQNGPYDVASGAWTRSADANTSASVPSGTAVFITEGTVNGGFGFRLTTANPIVLGTTSLTFAPTPVKNIGKSGVDTTYEGGVVLGSSAEETVSTDVILSATKTWHNVDSSGGVRIETLPNSAAIGSIHTIDDSTGGFGTNKCTVQSETATSLRSGASLVSSVDLTTAGGTWAFKKMTATVWKLLGGAP